MNGYLNETRALLARVQETSESLAQAGVELNTRLADYQDAEAEFESTREDFELWATTADDPLKEGAVNLFAGKNDDERKRNVALAFQKFGNDSRWSVNELKARFDEAETAWRRAQRAYETLCKDLDALKLQANVLSLLVAHGTPSTTSLPLAD
jgi:chromosome segregation ATPase